jgi:predicted CoA-substrate-specific enzyme activase
VEACLGIDIGSVTAKIVLLDDDNTVITRTYLPAAGRPAAAVCRGLKEIEKYMPVTGSIKGVAVTGSARHLVGALVGADIIKNEITCQAVAAIDFLPGVRTVIEIGGQDSKLIIIRDGMVVDFGMNTVCAAGTGSFLDHQAARLNMSIEEFSRQSLRGDNSVSITGRCTVFAESDMVHKQQMGCRTEDIIYGLCRALVRNYLGDVASGKEVQTPVVFQGGVAFNHGIIKALGEALGVEVIVPPGHEVMGAVGAGLLVREDMALNNSVSRFRGFDIDENEFEDSFYECPVIVESAGTKGLSPDNSSSSKCCDV